MNDQTVVNPRLDWALPFAVGVRWTRFVVLGSGLGLALVVSELSASQVSANRVVVAAIVFAAATVLTWTAAFTRFRPWVMTLIPVLDFATIMLFDLVGAADFVEALVVLPAMWLGLTFGRRGVAIAPIAVGLVVGLPDLFLEGGAPVEGWGPAGSVILLAGLAGAGVAASTDGWARQVRRLERQGRALETALEVKRDFVALASHELRTPLTSIIGYLELVDTLTDSMPDEAVAHLGAISRNADRLLVLVSDLLAAGEMETGALHLDLVPVDVATLARLSVNDACQRAGEAGLTIVRDLPSGTVRADSSRIVQVLDNLLSNAIKFTPAGGQISVSLVKRGAGVDLTVSDTGVGIDGDSLPQVATKFFRAPHATKAAIPGMGLGLMISKTIVEAHHGTLTVTSHEHEGTSVRVHLPLDPREVVTAAVRPPLRHVTRSHPRTGRSRPPVAGWVHTASVTVGRPATNGRMW
jgi:signal transduction histidine kinase